MTTECSDDYDTDDDGPPGMCGGVPRHFLFDRLSEHRGEVDGATWLFRKYPRRMINRLCRNVDSVVSEHLALAADWTNKTEPEREAVVRYIANVANTRLATVDVFDGNNHGPSQNVGIWEILIPILFQVVKWAIEWYMENRK